MSIEVGTRGYITHDEHGYKLTSPMFGYFGGYVGKSNSIEVVVDGQEAVTTLSEYFTETEFFKGQRVFSVVFGKGVVDSVSPPYTKSVYPVYVEFDDGVKFSFTKDGKWKNTPEYQGDKKSINPIFDEVKSESKDPQEKSIDELTRFNDFLTENFGDGDPDEWSFISGWIYGTSRNPNVSLLIKAQYDIFCKKEDSEYKEYLRLKAKYE